MSSESTSTSESDTAEGILATLSQTLSKYALKRKRKKVIKNISKKGKYTPSRPTKSPRESSRSSDSDKPRQIARLVKERSTSNVPPVGPSKRAHISSPQSSPSRRPPSTYDKPTKKSPRRSPSSPVDRYATPSPRPSPRSSPRQQSCSPSSSRPRRNTHTDRQESSPSSRPQLDRPPPRPQRYDTAPRPDHHDRSPTSHRGRLHRSPRQDPDDRGRPRRSPRQDRQDPDDRGRNAQELKQTLHNWAAATRNEIMESKVGLKIMSINNTCLARPFLGQACVFYNASNCELNRSGCNRRGKYYHHLCYLCHELLKVPSQHPAKNCPLKSSI